MTTKALAKREINTLFLSSPCLREKNPAWSYLSGLGKGSRQTMLEALAAMVLVVSKGERSDIDCMNWGALRHEHIGVIRAALQDRYSPATANKMLSALRGVLKEAFLLNLISAEDYVRAKEIKPVKGNSPLAGRALSVDELTALFNACASDGTPSGVRDGALLAVLRVGGLRRAELCALDLNDYDPASGLLTVRRGKGNKTRTVYVKNGATEWLGEWLALRGNSPGSLLCPVLKSGRVLPDQRLTPQAVFKAITKRARQAGIKPISPHDLRRTFISDLLNNGVDVSTVQRLAGHANVTTTTRYDRRGEEAKIEATKTLYIPHPEIR